MGFEYQDPVITEEIDTSGRKETKESHPCFAQISASRVSGQNVLYGSDFVHHNYIRISIRRSELHRDLNHDWRNAREEYIAVDMSEAQWATFISTMNVGEGTPCTLAHKDGKPIPQLNAPKNRQDQFQQELVKRFDRMKEHAKKLRASIEESKQSEKAKKELLGRLNMVEQEIFSNMGYVAQCFGEHIERTTEAAKVEISAYMTNLVQRHGLESVTQGRILGFSGEQPKQLESKDE